jgi:hypothetical protein
VRTSWGNLVPSLVHRSGDEVVGKEHFHWPLATRRDLWLWIRILAKSARGNIGSLTEWRNTPGAYDGISSLRHWRNWWQLLQCPACTPYKWGTLTLDYSHFILLPDVAHAHTKVCFTTIHSSPAVTVFLVLMKKNWPKTTQVGFWFPARVLNPRTHSRWRYVVFIMTWLATASWLV